MGDLVTRWLANCGVKFVITLSDGRRLEIPAIASVSIAQMKDGSFVLSSLNLKNQDTATKRYQRIITTTAVEVCNQ